MQLSAGVSHPAALEFGVSPALRCCRTRVRLVRRGKQDEGKKEVRQTFAPDGKHQGLAMVRYC